MSSTVHIIKIHNIYYIHTHACIIFTYRIHMYVIYSHPLTYYLCATSMPFSLLHYKFRAYFTVNNEIGQCFQFQPQMRMQLQLQNGNKNNRNY